MYREDISRLNVKKHKFRGILMGTASAVIMAAISQMSPACANDKKPTNIAQEDLGAALLAFAQQRQISIIYDPEQLKGKTSHEVSGRYSIPEVLQQLLTGSGYIYETDKKGNFYIRKQSYDKISDLNGFTNKKYALADNSSYFIENARTDIATTANQENDTEFVSNRKVAAVEEEIELEEIVTTGSHIRGAKSASPVFIYDRKDIDKTGLSTLPQFMRTLPQVFGGGASDGNIGISSANKAGLNVGGGSGINLRGLGTSSTLVLLDGNRMSTAGFGEFVDISLIPLTAIDRVEVLTDGASAIYGSDAVGGVVNFILRDNYEGAETRVRYGTVTEGRSDDLQIGQIFGANWDGGNGLISYEFNRRTALDSKDRTFTRDTIDPTDLLPEQTRHSVFVKAGQNLTEQVDFFGTAFYSQRVRKLFSGSTFSPETFFLSGPTEQYGATVGLETSISRSWQAKLIGTYNQNKVSNLTQTFRLPFDMIDAPVRETGSFNVSRVRTLEAKADGTLFSLSGGDVKMALGGQYRKEDLSTKSLTGQAVPSDRNIYSVYGEIFTPLIGSENSKPGFDRLELTLALRYEHYSDFGSTTDPKFGILWSPVTGLNFRGTFGTSFRAPLLTELSEQNLTTFLFSIPDPANPSQNIPGLIAFGNNANLQAETATTWTTGFDIKPDSIPGLNISLTYFNIKFKNRITDPGGGLNGFTDPKFAPLVTRNPDAALITLLTSVPNFNNFSPFDPADTKIIFDRRLRNLSTVDTSGLDFSLSYGFDTGSSSWNLTFNGTYLIERSEQIFATTEAIDTVDTVNNPAALRLTAGLSWSRNGFATNFLVNHTGSYKDVRVDPVLDVSSWTTIDLNISYNTEDRHNSDWLRNTIFSLSIQNLFDQDPPFVTDINGSNRNFDPDNATALGRFIAFQVTRKW